MRRRTLLKLGVGAAAVLAAIGGGMALIEPGLEADGRLRPGARRVMSGVARAVLDGLLPAEPRARDVVLAAHLQRLDATLAAFPKATRDELSQLFALLASAPGRMGLAGLRREWGEAGVDEIQQALQGMRLSSLSLRQQAYHGLRDLTNGAYFAEPSTWSALGYEGQVPV